MSIFVVPSVVSLAGHFDCSFKPWGESLGESKIKNRPLRCLRSRLLVPRAGSENPETTPFAICWINSKLAA